MTLLFGLGAAVFLAAIYSAITFYNPFIYINVIGTGALGFAIGSAIAKGGEQGKIRNRMVLPIIGLLCALAAEYVSWVVFIAALTDWTILLFDPGSIFSFMPMLAEKGYYSLAGSDVSGVILWILWGIEALIVLGLTVVMSMSSERVFCESSGDWAEDEKDIVRVQPKTETFFQDLIEERYQALDNDLQVLAPDTIPALRMDIARPRLRTASHYLSVVALTPKATKDGMEVETENVLSNLIVPAEVADQLHALAARAPVAPDEEDSEEDEVAASASPEKIQT